MTHRVRRHVDVETDILDLAAWIARDSKDAAYRFLGAVEDSILSLRSFPGRGSPKPLRDHRLAGVRSLAVAGFPKHLILFQQRGKEVYVLAVVHGARNYRKFLRGRIG